ncbi:MAG TPA: ABC transporter substrate-binding protein [Clostridia bacterium]|jgi:NitT/TauT family transport system substrate-binding protein|nr:ABC transporter substrate-binding protein [Clostridiaceae bacterium]HOA32607.1 ABC transporter substrate-binding protein [Clostridia bacterium]HPZ51526.1 ABC transporter substrate-binding protein [Clostridia bacterium]
MIKKIVPLVIVLAMLMTACTKADKQDKTTINVAALKGPTGMGMIKLIDDADKGNTKNEYKITLAGSPDEITGKIVSGEIQIAALPINLAANLYNKTNGKVQLLALNTLGVLYVLEKGEEINSVSDLEGKKIFATGQGATPEYILDYILKENNVNADVEFKTEHSELAALALSGNADIVMLPEPFVTNVLSKEAGFRVALDLTEEFERVSDGTVLSMGCIVVNKEFAEKNKQAVKDFLDEYKASTEFVNNNISEASDLIAKYGILASKELAEKAIPNCNIVFIEGGEMEQKIKGFYELLNEYNANSIGGKLPGEDFYYKG